MDNESLKIRIWLSSRFSQGSVIVMKLLAYFGSPEKVYEAGANELQNSGVMMRGKMGLFLDKSLGGAEKIISDCMKCGAEIAAYDDIFYPTGLKSLKNAPAVIYYKGNLKGFDERPRVAMVGSRKPTANGLRTASDFSGELAQAGVAVVSGLADGIDSAAHRAALEAGGFTAAVLGCGIDKVYPYSNRALGIEIEKHGVIISEYPPGVSPDAVNFPNRNRIISALSDEVAVIEGGLASGSLITAEHAINQHKPLWAVPSGIYSAEALGSNSLLEKGARPLLGTGELISKLKMIYGDRICPAISPAIPKKPEALLTPEESEILSLLTESPKTADEIETNMNVSKLMRILSSLEIKGLALSMPGGRYALKK